MKKKLHNDEYHMRRALEIARRGSGSVLPNPLVGAVVVKNGVVVGEGWHAKFGGDHAEVVALRDAGSAARGAVLYVTLEPCCHHGKTSPCTDAVIRAGVVEVVIACLDTNPVVDGGGVAALRSAGVKVRIFDGFKPYVTLKIACTVDGKIAAKRGEEISITGPASRRRVHEMRAEHDSVLTSTATVLADDPHLGVRRGRAQGLDPLRVVVGRRALSPSLNVFRDGNVVIYREHSPKKILQKLARRGVTSALVEAGCDLNTAWLQSGVVDEVHMFVAPKFFGATALKAFDALNSFTLCSCSKKEKDVLLVFKLLQGLS